MNINLQNLIGGAITVFAGVIIIFVITYFIKKVNSASQVGELKFGLLIKGMGLACLLFSATTLFVFLTGKYQAYKPGQTISLILLTIGFGAGAIYTLADGFFVKGNYDEKSIFFSTPWTGKKNEKWDDLESIKFNYWCYWYVLKFKSGKIIRLSPYLRGYNYLLMFLRYSGHNF